MLRVGRRGGMLRVGEGGMLSRERKGMLRWGRGILGGEKKGDARVGREKGDAKSGVGGGC